MSKVSDKIKEEFLAMIPPTIFFFVALHIVALVRVLMLKGTGITPMTSAAVTIAALVLGKSVLLADMLINRFPEKPLIYNVAWKTVIYLVVAASFTIWNVYTILRGKPAELSPATKSCSLKSCGRTSGRFRSSSSC
jgi:hypothetical protein